MRPLRFMMEYFRAKRADRARRKEFVEKIKRADIVIPELIVEVHERAAKFGLDPELPDLIAFKRQIPEAYRRFGERYCRHLMDQIDPTRDFSVTDTGVIVVHERMLGGVLMPWTIAEYQFGGPSNLHQQLARIVVNCSGAHLFDEDGRKLVSYSAAVCNPHRLADPGNRLRNAAAVIEHHTGVGLDWHKFVGAYSATIELVDGAWQAEVSYDSATA